jgi:hypothetical protein
MKSRPFANLMSAKKLWDARSKLRKQILTSFPGQSPAQIFATIKTTDTVDLTFPDFAPFCEAASIDESLLPEAFQRYSVVAGKISEKKFESFINDEYIAGLTQPAVPNNLNLRQLQILRRLCRAIRTRRTQGTAPPMHRTPEAISISQSWVPICRLSHGKDQDSPVRVASLCRISADLNTGVDPESLVDALWCFLGQQCDSITFDQFCTLLTTF